MINKPPKNIAFFSILIIVLSFTTEFYFEISAAMFLFLFLFILFWKEKTPPVILAALLLQWLAISIGYLYLSISSLEHKDLLRRPFYSLENINTAYWLSMIGLFIFSVGLKTPLFNYQFKMPDNKLIQKYDTFKVILFYIAFSIGSDMLFNGIRFIVPGLSEPVKMLGYFKWSLFFIMLYLSFTRNEHKTLVFIIMAVEIIVGFTGIFSTFKDIFYLFPIVYLSFNKLRIKQTAILIILAVIIFNIGVVWSYVKVEQRIYLSGGARAQIVTVSKLDALKHLYKLTSQFSWQKYDMGLTALIQRLYYIEYFSATIRYIPKYKAHFDGEIWKKAIKHVLMPRILFPNKEGIDDSKQTTNLTGIQLAGAKQGTSISVGYMAESYADFGTYYMFAAIFVLGFVIGLVYKLISNTAINSLWSVAMVFPMFYIININGMNAIKVTGKIFMFLIIFYLLDKFVLIFIDRIILNNESK